MPQKYLYYMIKSNTFYNNNFIFAGRCLENSDCTGPDEFCLNAATEAAACKRKLSLSYPLSPIGEMI